MSDPTSTIPFMRNGKVRPIIVPVTADFETTETIGHDALKTAGVTAFFVHNLNPFAVWFIGWKSTDSTPTTAYQNGNLIGPGESFVQSSTRPDALCAMPQDTLLAPLYDAQGGLLYDLNKAWLGFVFGSGN